MNEVELWTRHDVADHCQLAISSVNRWIKRHDVAVIRTDRDEHGRLINLYDAARVRAVRASQPGSGNRTPRKEQP